MGTCMTSGHTSARRTADECVEGGDRISDLVPSRRGQRGT